MSEGTGVRLLGWVGKRGALELDHMPDEVAIDTEKGSSKKSGEVHSELGDGFSKHELRMQKMTENMEEIIQMIAWSCCIFGFPKYTHSVCWWRLAISAGGPLICMSVSV